MVLPKAFTPNPFADEHDLSRQSNVMERPDDAGQCGEGMLNGDEVKHRG
jgi:hypothetical protein